MSFTFHQKSFTWLAMEEHCVERLTRLILSLMGLFAKSSAVES